MKRNKSGSRLIHNDCNDIVDNVHRSAMPAGPAKAKYT